MPDKIALHDDPNFDALLAAAAAQEKAPLSVVIKDYWLTEALAALSRATDFRVIFKGGTSLSKGWRLIDRFSEDIDLLVAPPKDDTRLGQAASETLLKKVLKTFENDSMFTPSTDPAQKPTGGKKPPRRASYFRYPGSDQATADGLLPHLKVELAIHNGNSPNTPRPIQSILAKIVSERGGDAAQRYQNIDSFQVICLDPLRTFTEKVSLLAQAYERGEIMAYCRHYYDLYFLLAEESITSRLGSKEHTDIKNSIREIDELYGVQKPQDFYAALGSSPAFVFDAPLRDEVSRRYDAERIYYGRKPPFLEIVERITVIRGRF